MKKWISILFVLLLTSFVSTAYAELKIGIVDMNAVLQKAPLMVSINNGLIAKFKPRQDDIINAKKQLDDETNQLNMNTTMSPDQRSKMQNKIISDQANVQILTASLQRDLAIAKDQGMQTFMAKFVSVINKIAQGGNYDLIQQRTDTIFVNNKLDITSQVLQELK